MNTWNHLRPYALKPFNYKDILVQLHRNNDYSKNVTTLNNRAVDLLILFLEMNGYAYNPDIAMVWFEEIRPHFGKQADSYRRALCTIPHQSTWNPYIVLLHLISINSLHGASRLQMVMSKQK